MVARLRVPVCRIGFCGGRAVAEIPQIGINGLFGLAGEGYFHWRYEFPGGNGEGGKWFLGADGKNKR